MKHLVTLVLLLVSMAGVAHEAERTAQGAMDHRAMRQPARNTLFSCERETMGDALSRPWVDANGLIYFARKPVIEGSVSWDSRLDISRDEQNTQLKGNGLPSHPTGEFPVDRSSTAYAYDRNPNSIRSHSIEYVIPTQPVIADAPSCLPMGTIGVALSGGVFFNALDADGRDAVANEVFDACEGHPQRQGQYHYHHGSPCFAADKPGEHSPLVGYALDGFGVYGSRGERGAVMTNDKLDECHGHVGEVPAMNGSGNVTVYHYHLNNEFPYTLGCFRGKVDHRLFRHGQGEGMTRPPLRPDRRPDGLLRPMRRP